MHSCCFITSSTSSHIFDFFASAAHVIHFSTYPWLKLQWTKYVCPKFKTLLRLKLWHQMFKQFVEDFWLNLFLCKTLKKMKRINYNCRVHFFFLIYIHNHWHDLYWLLPNKNDINYRHIRKKMILFQSQYARSEIVK